MQTHEDPLAPARGILIACVVSIPIWIILGLVVALCLG